MRARIAVPISRCMHLRAAAVALALLGAHGHPPDLSSTDKVVEMAPSSFTSYGAYFVTLDDGTTAAQQLFDHDPSEAPDVTGEVQHFRVAGVDYFVVAVA
jgi:hypothetical protein